MKPDNKTFELITQIIPARDCFAILLDEDGNEWGREPVVCWALTADGTVHGMITDGDFPIIAERRNDFGYYMAKGSKYRKGGPTAPFKKRGKKSKT